MPTFEALNGGDWTELVSNDEDLEQRLISQGLKSQKSVSITWDDANLFFLSCIHLPRWPTDAFGSGAFKRKIWEISIW